MSVRKRDKNHRVSETTGRRSVAGVTPRARHVQHARGHVRTQQGATRFAVGSAPAPDLPFTPVSGSKGEGSGAYAFTSGHPYFSKAGDPLSHTPTVLVSMAVKGVTFELFERALASILNQSHGDLVVVVAHDGADGAEYRRSKYLADPRVVQRSSKKTYGPHAHHEVALRLAATIGIPIFTVHDADDASGSRRLELLVGSLERADVAFSTVAHHALAGTITKIPESNLRGVTTGPELIHPVDHFGAFRTDFLEQFGYYFGYRFGSDTLVCNLAMRYGACVHVPSSEADYQRFQRAGSLTTKSATAHHSAARKQVDYDLNRIWSDIRKWDPAELGVQLRKTVPTDEHVALAEQVVASKKKVQEAAGHARGRRAANPVVAKAEKSLYTMVLSKALKHAVFDDWSINRACAEALFEELMRRRPSSIVDFGSGVSTLVAALYAGIVNAQRDVGRGTGILGHDTNPVSVVALDHQDKYLARTRAALDAAGLASPHVNLVAAPLVRLDKHGVVGRTYQYEFQRVPPIDFVFIDGPPESVGRNATLPSVVDRLAPQWAAWLHDAVRPGERRIVAEWAKKLPCKFTVAIDLEADPRGIAKIEGR